MDDYADPIDSIPAKNAGPAGRPRPAGSIASRWSGWFRRSTGARDTAIPVHDGPFEGLKWDYEQLARDACARYAIEPTELHIEAIALGTDQGKQVYALLLTGSGDSPASVSRAQLLAPVIERRIVTAVVSNWIGDHSRFAGVWTRWPSHLRLPVDVRTALNRNAARPAA